MSPAFERRQYQRYTISLDVQIAIRKRGNLIACGEGKIQDVSRAGILFQSTAVIPPGTVLRLVVPWPFPFRGKTPVDWIVDGVVLRHTPSGTAMNIMRHRFEGRARQNEEKASASDSVG